VGKVKGIREAREGRSKEREKGTGRKGGKRGGEES